MVWAGRQVLRDGHELGGHDPAGRVLGVAEQLLDLGRLVALHEGEDLVARRLGQVGHEVRGVVRRHLLEDVGGPGGLEVLEHLDLRLGLHLLDRVGHGLVIERGEHAGPVARRELVDDRGEVGRVQLGQARVGHAQLDRRDRRLDRVDILPVDVPLRHRDAEVAGERARGPLDPEPAQQARPAHVDGDEVERPADFVEAEIVDPHDLAPVDVDDLLVHQVGPQEDLVGPLLELADVDGGGAQLGPARVEGFDRRPGYEDAPPVRLDDEAGDRWIATAEGDDEVGDLTHLLVVHVTYRPADRLAQVQHLPPRGRVLAHGWRASRECRVALDRPSGRGPGVWPWRRPSGSWRRGYWVRCPPGTDPSDATWSGHPTACATVRADRRGPGRV